MTDRRSDRGKARDLRVKLAEQLIQHEPGQRLPSIRELARASHMSVGSVSTALNELQAGGAVKIQNRGHLGSILTELSLGALWSIVEQGPLVIALTLPMHSRFEGLATAVKLAFEQYGVETYLIFIRGSTTRLKALREGRCHAAMMSGLAAESHSDKETEVIVELPPGTWISRYCVFYRELQPKDGRPLRVAVDRDSSDHLEMSRLVFAGQSVEYKTGSYVQISRQLKSGEVDATLWTVDQADAFMSEGVHAKPVADDVIARLGVRSTAAAFVARADDAMVQAVFKAAIKPEEIQAIQDRVVAGDMLPAY